MKQRHAVIVLLALIMASGLTSFGSYSATERLVSEDMDRALSLALEEQQSDVISQDTIRTFNSHLQIAGLRGKATLAVDTRSQQFRAYARCSEATIFSLSDQRPATVLWVLTGLWAMFVWRQQSSEKLKVKSEKFAAAQISTGQTVAIPLADGNTFGGLVYSESDSNTFGGLMYSESESRFYAADGNPVRLTPMQHRLMEMFFQSPSHSLTKSEICDALWPKKPDASETLYTLIRRLKPVVEQHSDLRIESDRSRAYRLVSKGESF